jgi:hypothetical protein
MGKRHLTTAVFLIVLLIHKAQTSPPLMEGLFGPTTANAASGNQGLTIAVSKYGELVNLKWPLPNYYDHLNYKSLYPLPINWQVENYNRFHNAQPRQGSFVGIEYKNAGSIKKTTWLRDSTWTHKQYYQTKTSPVIITEYYNASLQLTVKSIDFVVSNQDAYLRKYIINWANSSLIQNAKIVFIASMAPCNKNPSNDPNTEWAVDYSNGFANEYYSPKGEFVSFIPNAAVATPSLIPNIFSSQSTIDNFVTNLDVTFPSLTSTYNTTGLLTVKDIYCVIGADRMPLTHGMESDYGFAQTMPDTLIPNGQSTSANAAMLYNIYGVNLGSITNSDEIIFQYAFGPKYSLAQTTYDNVFATPFNTILNSTINFWNAKLTPAILPQTGDTIMQKVLQRILVNTFIGTNRGVGSIGSSVCSSQPAYSQQWVRDASIMGYMLDCAGYTAEAEQQALFFNAVQRTSFGQDCLTPANNDCYKGTWSQCYYADGRPSWVHDFEIDEAGFGVWMLYVHSTFLNGIAKINYLNSVYASIKRGAYFLKDFKDPVNNLQKAAKEDDVLWTSQTIYGAATTLMGLKAALSAAQFLNDSSTFQNVLQLRIAELETAIETHKWGLSGNMYDYKVYGNFGGRSTIVWPALLHDTLHLKMISHTDSLNNQILPFFTRTNASLNYEWWYVGKTLTAMAYMWRSNPIKKPIIENYLKTVLKHVPTEGTYSYGETVMVRDMDSLNVTVRKYDNRVGQPSNYPPAWFYLTAQMLYGSNPQLYVGINRHEELNNSSASFKAFPNPFNNQITLQFNQTKNSSIQINVHNAIGQLVFSEKKNIQFNALTIETNHLKQGIYFVSANDGNGSKTIKIIKTE